MHASMPDAGQVASALQTGLENYANLYSATDREVKSVAQEIVTRMFRINRAAFESAIEHLVDVHRNAHFARAAYPYVTDPRLKRVCAIPWIASAAATARSLRQDQVGIG